MKAHRIGSSVIVETGSRPFIFITRVEKTYRARGRGLKAVDGISPHVTDIANVIKWESLSNIVLVGHSWIVIMRQPRCTRPFGYFLEKTRAPCRQAPTLMRESPHTENKPEPRNAVLAPFERPSHVTCWRPRAARDIGDISYRTHG